MEVEDVSGVGLSTGGSSEEERHLSVGDSLLGQVIVDDASVLGGGRSESERKTVSHRR